MDHRRSGHRPRVLGAAHAVYGPLRRRAGRAAQRSGARAGRSRARDRAGVVRAPAPALQPRANGQHRADAARRTRSTVRCRGPAWKPGATVGPGREPRLVGGVRPRAATARSVADVSVRATTLLARPRAQRQPYRSTGGKRAVRTTPRAAAPINGRVAVPAGLAASAAARCPPRTKPAGSSSPPATA